MSESVIHDNQQKNVLLANDEARLNVDTEHQLYLKYHQSELDHNETLLKHCLVMMWVGIGMLVIGLCISLFTKECQSAVLVAGAFVDLFSGGIITLVNKSADSKQRYFESISKSENEQRLISEVDSIQSEEKKTELLGKIIDGHYR